MRKSREKEGAAGSATDHNFASLSMQRTVARRTAQLSCPGKRGRRESESKDDKRSDGAGRGHALIGTRRSACMTGRRDIDAKSRGGCLGLGSRCLTQRGVLLPSVLGLRGRADVRAICFTRVCRVHPLGKMKD